MSSDLANRLSGRFIVIDGPDGAGKSTQLRMLAEWLVAQGVDVLTTRDPGGTAIGDRIRQILLDNSVAEMNVACETMLYMASRAQLVGQVIRPALAEGRCVLCDRFVSSTVAYQSAGGANAEDVLAVARVAVGGVWPDLTIVLDIDHQAGLARVPGKPDRMESKGAEFHARVREGFRRQAQRFQDRFVLVDADGERQAVAGRVRDGLIKWASK